MTSPRPFGIRTSLRRSLAAAVAVVSVLAAGACDRGPEVDDAMTPAVDASVTTGRPITTGADGPVRYRPAVVATIDRAPDGFTQGFVFDDRGRLWESIGLEGSSALRLVDPDDATVLEYVPLPHDQFGEGLTVGPDGLVQLTWRDGIAYRWTTDPVTSAGVFRYDGEGWGLTWDGEAFVQSDGSSTLTWRDPVTFEVIRTVEVHLDGRPLDQLNELEWVDGAVWANVWHSDDIVRIDPRTGEVTGVIDASGLWNPPERTSEMTLNGIAHRPGDPPTRLWLTGKFWPHVFVVDLIEEER